MGDRIKSLRERAGVTQEQLAERVRVSSHTIRNWEKGNTSPTAANMAAIAGALGVQEADLVAPHRSGSSLGRAGARGQSTGSRLDPGRPVGDSTGMGSDRFNVPGGRVDELRAPGVQPLPIYRWGSLGDPRDHDSAPDPDRLEYPPLGRETLIGPNGFGVEARGDSMVGRGIADGAVCWVNPERPYRLGSVVLALVSDDDGEGGMVVKTWTRTDVGECLMSETDSGRSTVVCDQFTVIGPVVWISPPGFPPR